MFQEHHPRLIQVGMAIIVMAALTGGTGTGAAAPSSSSSCTLPVLTELDTPAGDLTSHTIAIDDSGNAVGTVSGRARQQRSVWWDHHGRIADLPGALVNEVTAMSGNGWIAGTGQTPSQPHTMLWDRAGNVTNLGVPPGYFASYATGVNNTGTTVGFVVGAAVFANSQAARWDRQGQATILENLAGGHEARASGVNDAGVTVGAVFTAEDSLHAVRWDPTGHIIDLKAPPGRSDSAANAINNAGTVVGITFVTGQGLQGLHAVRWDPQGQTTELPRLPGDSFSKAEAINDSGVIVGNGSATHYAETHALRWNSQGQPTNLGTFPGGTYSDAIGINNQGTIIGVANTPSDGNRPVAWRCDKTR